MNINCLDQDFKLVKVIIFNFNDTQFQIDVIDENVIYLKIIYSTFQQLSLLHLFLVQHKQGTLGIKAKIIIVGEFQPSIEEKCILYNQQNEVQEDQYWLNIATLSVQIGFKVKCISKENTKIFKDTKNDIIVVSKFPEFDICQLDDHFVKFGKTPKDLFNVLKLPEKKEKFKNSFLVLLQYISLKIHKIQDYSHFLPMTLAYNAYQIYNKINNQINSDVMNNQLSEFQQIYKDASLSKEMIAQKQQINYFNLPLHLLNIFTFDQNNKFIFQQMCNISYFYKAEFFCIYQQYNDLKNAVTSQSSRSGKSVTILSVYYFNILTKQKIPIYINLGYDTTPESSIIQPLYNLTSINVKEQLNQLNFIFYDSQQEPSFQSLYTKTLYASVQYQTIFVSVFKQIKLSLQKFDVGRNQILLELIYKNLMNGSFQQFGSNYSNLIQKLFLNQKNYLINLFTKKNDISNSDIIILVDEVLQQQKEKFNKCPLLVQKLTNFFSNQFLINAKTELKTIFSQDNLKFISEKQPDYLKILKDIFEIEENDDTLVISNILTIVNTISSDKMNINYDKYIYRLVTQKLFLEKAQLKQIIYFICLTSPNFLNLKQQSNSIVIFLQCFKDLFKFPFKNVFQQCLYKFIIQLYNPRVVETIFWRNLYHDLNITQQMDLSNSRTFNQQMSLYLQDQLFDFSYFNINKQNTNYYQIPIPFNHLTVNFLSTGTDLAIINFIAQNELLYTSTNSRHNKEYIQSHVISGVQLHSSLLGQDYYQKSTISYANNETLMDQVDNRLDEQDLLQFYQLLVPELASEVQFVCPLISPQIIIPGTKNNSLVTNSVTASNYMVNFTTNYIRIINSYDLIIDSLQILRDSDKITLKLAQGNITNQQIILGQNIKTYDFKEQLFISTSMQLNQEMVFYFFFKASQNFIGYLLNQNIDDKIIEQANLTLLNLKYTTISEISAILLFLFAVTDINQENYKKYLQNCVMKKVFLELFYVEQKMYSNPVKAIDIMKKCFKNAQFMFIQPCLDYIVLSWNIDEENKMSMLIKYLYNILATAYQNLIQLSCIKQRLNNGSRTTDPFIIGVPIDKNNLYNKFLLSGSISDFLVAFFPSNQEDSIYLSKCEFLTQKQEIINGKLIIFYTCIVESGIHTGKDLVKKAGEYFSSIFQVNAESVKDREQYCLFQEGAAVSQEAINKRDVVKTKKQPEIIQLLQNQNRFYIDFDKLFKQFYQDAQFDTQKRLYFIDLDKFTNLKDYLYIKQQEQLEIHFISNFQNDIYYLAVNSQKLIQKFIIQELYNEDKNFKLLIENYQKINFDEFQIDNYIKLNLFTKDITQLNSILVASYSKIKRIKIINYKMNDIIIDVVPDQIIQFLNRKSLVIIGYSTLCFNGYLAQSRIEIITSWFLSYETIHSEDYGNPQIKSYIDTFKSLILTEIIAENANLELFGDSMTVKMQIEKIISDQEFYKIENNGRIRIVFSDKVQISHDCESSFDSILECVDQYGSIIIEFEVQPKSKQLKLFIIK